MRRKDLEKRIRGIGKAMDVSVDFEEGGKHIIVRFDGKKVTTIPRHNEINEFTAKGIIDAAEHWKGW